MKRIFAAVFCSLLLAGSASAQYSRTVMADANWRLQYRNAIVKTNSLAVRLGDLSGTTNSTTVTGLRGKSIPAPGAGDTGKAYVYNSGTGTFVLQSVGGATNLSTKVNIMNGVATNLAMRGSTEARDATNSTQVVNWRVLTGYVATNAWRMDQYGNLISSGYQKKVLTRTTDGADTNSLGLSGGGDTGRARGAYMWLSGNEAVGGGDAVLSAGTSGDIQFQTLDQDRMTIRSNGQVAVGTKWLFSPTDGTLWATTTVASTEGHIYVAKENGSNNGALYLSGGSAMGRAQGAHIYLDGSRRSGGNLSLSPSTIGHIRFYSMDALRMIVHSNGNVGFGTDSPVKRIHLYGTAGNDTQAKIEGHRDVPWASSLLMQNNDAGNDAGASVVFMKTNSQSYAAIKGHNKFGLSFIANGQGNSAWANADLFLLSSNNCFGVRTNFPVAPLHVRGETRHDGSISFGISNRYDIGTLQKPARTNYARFFNAVGSGYLMNGVPFASSGAGGTISLSTNVLIPTTSGGEVTTNTIVNYLMMTNWVVQAGYLTNEPSWQAVSNNVAYRNRANNFSVRPQVNGTNVLLAGEAGTGNVRTDINNTYSGGTTQIFAMASVTNRADYGTEIVNWMTMTNWVIGSNYASKAYAQSLTNGLAKFSVTNGLATRLYAESLTNGLASFSVTNGLASFAVTNGLASFSVTNGLAKFSVTNGLASFSVTNGLASFSVTNGLATRLYAESLTNGLASFSVTNGLASFSVTNGLASFSVTNGLAKFSVTNGLATRLYAESLTNGLASFAVTNGLASFSVTNGLASFSVTNGLASFSVTNGLAKFSVTNGLATRLYAESLTNGLASFAVTNGLASFAVTNGLASFAVTNGLASFSVTNGLASFSVTNGLASFSVTNGLAKFSVTNGLAKFSVTNGLATRLYAESLTNGLASFSVTNGLAKFSVTNGLAKFSVTNGLAEWQVTTNWVTERRGIGGVFSMTGGVTNQNVQFGTAFAVNMWPVVNVTTDATFQVAPEIVYWSKTNFIFRLRGASGFVTNAWRVMWNANPSL